MSCYFNPRSPHGERHTPGSALLSDTNFNPRSPHGERPGITQCVATENKIISIHAPRTGSDWRLFFRKQESGNFTPRSPHGERPAERPAAARAARNFNPRSPHGERLAQGYQINPATIFQSTLPARGATRILQERRGRLPFQSTLPARGATAQSNNSVDQNHRLCTKSIPQNSPFEN